MRKYAQLCEYAHYIDAHISKHNEIPRISRYDTSRFDRICRWSCILTRQRITL